MFLLGRNLFKFVYLFLMNNHLSLYLAVNCRVILCNWKTGYLLYRRPNDFFHKIMYQLLMFISINKDVRQVNTQLRSQFQQSQRQLQSSQFPLLLLQVMHHQKNLALGAGRVSFALIMVFSYLDKMFKLGIIWVFHEIKSFKSRSIHLQWSHQLDKEMFICSGATKTFYDSR